MAPAALARRGIARGTVTTTDKTLPKDCARPAHGPHDLPTLDLAHDVLLLDVDGTLVDIAPTPETVHVPAALRQALARLEEKSGGGVALISGRPLASLDDLFAPLKLPAAGCHGAEIRPRVGADEAEFDAVRLPDSVRTVFSGLGAQIAGLRIEDKGFTLAFHYRSIKDRERDVIAAVEAGMARLPPGYEMLRGKAIVEIKPTGFNKGTALHELMKHAPFKGRRPIFHGDDVTDEDVFQALPTYGGIGISVGRHIDGAEYCVESPRDIRRWLLHLAGMDMEQEP